MGGPARLLLCGTNYARAYLAAAEMTDTFALAGVLARGSARSVRLTERLKIPLFRRVEELPEAFDIACVAVGSSRFDVVLGLLQRGIPVLSEHPLRCEQVRSGLETASRHGTCFHVNAHFSLLTAPQAFITRSLQETASSPPLFLEMRTNDRSLYPALDILKSALESLRPAEVFHVGLQPPFLRASGSFTGVPFSLHCQDGGLSEIGVLEDASAGYLVDLSLVVGFAQGLLTMTSIAGPVVWSRNYNREGRPDKALWEWVGGGSPSTRNQVRAQRMVANLRAMDQLLGHVREGVIPRHQEPDHLCEISTSWQMLEKAMSETKLRCSS